MRMPSGAFSFLQEFTSAVPVGCLRGFLAKHSDNASDILAVINIRMKSIAAITLVLATIPFVGAQSGRNSTADQEWADILKLTAPGPVAAGKKTPAAVSRDRVQAATNARTAAQAAKDFYTRNPTHVRASDARKKEAIQGLLGVTADDGQYEHSALQIADLYRANLVYRASNRFEVALLSERVVNRAKLGGTPFGNKPDELQKIGDRLRREFGDIPDVFGFYVSIARSADMATAKRLANSIIAWPAGADEKAEAEQILKRDALLNKPLNLKLSKTNGEILDLSKQSGRVTLVYAWSIAASSSALSPLQTVKASLPANAQVIYLGIGGTAEEAEAARGAAPIPGIFCVETRTTGSTVHALGLRSMPYEFVLNDTGNRAGFGPIAEATNLVAAVSRYHSISLTA